MDYREFEKAMSDGANEPELEELLQRFQHAYQATRGSKDAAMAAVNEVLNKPIPYKTFLARLREEAG